MKEADKRTILRFTDGHFETAVDTVVVESPITIYLNGREFLTIVCTPDYIEDMVVGFLASERVIRRYEDIQNIQFEEAIGFVHVHTKKSFPYFEKLQSKRYITSCCGMSRQGFVFTNDALTAKTMTERHIILTPAQCLAMMEALEQASDMFQRTGGVHNAALCDQNGELLSRMDIGRHNALDKLYGHCLKHRIPVADKIIAFSGRISSEILLKVAKIGCEIILSKSAPTGLALELANQLGITTVGFIRQNSFNVYTHPERIQA